MLPNPINSQGLGPWMLPNPVKFVGFGATLRAAEGPPSGPPPFLGKNKVEGRLRGGFNMVLIGFSRVLIGFIKVLIGF